jgi:hypothetical protein
MMNETKVRVAVTALIVTIGIGSGVFAGVRQMRSGNGTNTQAYVNPYYANQATQYWQARWL